MKITTIFLFACFLSVSATTLAQKITLKEKNASLSEVLNQIRRQSGYDVICRDELLNKSAPVTVSLNNASLDDALNASLQDQALTYEIEDGTIIIKEKDVSLLDKAKALFAQVTVTGKVIDELGNPMIGVTVKQKDKPTNATSTDAKGNYTLNVTDNNSVLVFSFIGYETQELAAKDIVAGSVITLKVAENNLNEVIVSKGYYNEKRALSTGDVSRVTAKELENQPVADIMQAMEGRVAGLYISQTSGDAGAYGTIRIMGQNSFIHGSDPLYIIDGVPYSSLSLTSPYIGGGILGAPLSNGTNAFTPGGMSPFSLLAPTDIENIEVLKDADATAIYGSRGANGVILITTKKGSAGETVVNADVSQGIGQVTRTMDLLNTQQYLQMRHEALRNDGFTTTSNNYHAAYDLNGVWDTTRYTNWQKLLIGNTAHYNNANISISGGNSNTQFLLGGTFNRQTTVYPGDYSDNKISGFFNLNHQSINRKFTIGFSAMYVSDNSNLPNSSLTSVALSLAPDAPRVYNSDGTLNWQMYNGSSTWGNPLAQTLMNANAKTTNLVTNLSLTYQLLSGLQLESHFGYNRGQMDQLVLEPAAEYPPPVANVAPSNRLNLSSTNENSTWIIEPTLSYKHKFRKSRIEALLGSTFQEMSTSINSLYATNFASDALLSYLPAAGTVQSFGESNALYRYSSVYGRIGYTFDEKYIINLTGRRDGSSRFGPGRQFGNFGAIGAGWIFSKEKAIDNSMPWLSFGKLRASYGVTGNDQIGNYQYLSTYTAVSNAQQYLGSTTFNPTGLTNPYFSWERVKKLEGGIDLGFLKDRIDITISYYRSRDDNQLINYALPAVTGFTSIQANLPATIQNTAWEFTLNTQNINGKNFKWSTAFNLTLPSNTIVAFPNIQNTSYKTTFAVGQSFFSTYLYHFSGVNPQTGLYTFSTPNANGLPSLADRIISKPITQTAYGGVSNNFSYKNFQLSILFQFVKQLGYNYLRYTSYPGRFNQNEPVYVSGAWQQPGSVSNIQKFTETSGNAATAYSDLSVSDAAISDASFIRLKNLAFSYSLPTTIAKTLSLRTAKIYFQAQNLLTITGYKGLDPETQSYNLPPLRILSVGLQAGF